MPQIIPADPEYGYNPSWLEQQLLARYTEGVECITFICSCIIASVSSYVLYGLVAEPLLRIVSIAVAAVLAANLWVAPTIMCNRAIDDYNAYYRRTYRAPERARHDGGKTTPAISHDVDHSGHEVVRSYIISG